MTDKALARVDTSALLMSGGLDGMMKGAAMLIKSGLLPRQINRPEQAIVIMLKGQELGIPPMEALSRMYVVNGKPSLSASLMAALVEREMGTNALIVEESTDTHCTVSVLKPGWDKRRSVTFSMQDARKAGLTGGNNDMYAKYPRAMLRSRAISEACETYFQSIVGGIYTPEELGDAPAEEDIQDAAPTSAPPVTVDEPEDVEVDRETGEIIGEYTEVEDEVEDEVPFTLPDEEEEEVKVPGDGKEFFAFMRDFNKIQGLEGDDALAPDDIIFSDMDADQRLKMVKSMFWKALKTKVRKADSAGELNQIKKDWGEHPAWVDELNGLWQSRLASVGKPEGAMV